MVNSYSVYSEEESGISPRYHENRLVWTTVVQDDVCKNIFLDIGGDNALYYSSFPKQFILITHYK